MYNNFDRQSEYETKLLKILVIIFGSAAIIAAAYFTFKYLFVWLLPFILAWLVATAINPLVNFASRKMKLPKKLASFIFVVFAVALLCFILYMLIMLLTAEAASFLQNLGTYKEDFNLFFNNISVWLSKAASFLPSNGDGDTAAKLIDSVLTAIGGTARDLLTVVTQWLTKIPSILLLIVVTAISAYLLSSKFAETKRFLINQISEKYRGMFIDVQREMIKALSNYFKAYSIILCITFLELVLGLTFLGVKGAITISIVTAIVDILPVFGVGTVLLPWSVFSFVTGDTYTGVGLIIIYVVIMVLRQIIEPHIVGTRTGLNPLVTILSLYIGFKVMGVAGMLLFPFFMIIVKYLNDSGKVRLWKKVEFEDKNEEKDKKINGKKKAIRDK